MPQDPDKRRLKHWGSENFIDGEDDPSPYKVDVLD